MARSAAIAAAAGSTTRRASSSERTRSGSKVPHSRCQASSCGSSRFQLSRARTTMPSRGRASIRPLAARKRTASRSAVRLTWKRAHRSASFGSRPPGGQVAFQDAQAQAADHVAMDSGPQRQGRHASPARRSCRSWIITATISKAPLAISW